MDHQLEKQSRTCFRPEHNPSPIHVIHVNLAVTITRDCSANGENTGNQGRFNPRSKSANECGSFQMVTHSYSNQSVISSADQCLCISAHISRNNGPKPVTMSSQDTQREEAYFTRTMSRKDTRYVPQTQTPRSLFPCKVQVWKRPRRYRHVRPRVSKPWQGYQEDHQGGFPVHP